MQNNPAFSLPDGDRHRHRGGIRRSISKTLGDPHLLAGRLVELRTTRPEDDEDRERIRTEIQVTDDLIDLVSCRLYCLTDEETGRIRGFGI